LKKKKAWKGLEEDKIVITWYNHGLNVSLFPLVIIKWLKVVIWRAEDTGGGTTESEALKSKRDSIAKRTYRSGGGFKDSHRVSL